MIQKRSQTIEEFRCFFSIPITMSRLHERILKLIEKEYSNLKKEEYSGFRARRSCTDILFKTGN